MRPPKPRTTELGIFLAGLREQQGLTLSDLSSLTEPELSTSYLSQLELGGKNPTPRAIRIISRAMGIHPNQLFFKTDIIDLTPDATLQAGAQLEALNLEVTVEERTLLVAYLEFLRFKASIEIG